MAHNSILDSLPSPNGKPRLFKFVGSDGQILIDNAGRRVFSMMQSTAEQLAVSMGATAKRV